MDGAAIDPSSHVAPYPPPHGKAVPRQPLAPDEPCPRCPQFFRPGILVLVLALTVLEPRTSIQRVRPQGSQAATPCAWDVIDALVQATGAHEVAIFHLSEERTPDAEVHPAEPENDQTEDRDDDGGHSDPPSSPSHRRLAMVVEHRVGS